MDALAVLRSADVPLALVHDEYGHLDGIVTPGSILAALAGAFAHDVEHGEDPPLVEREDGSWLVSGAASADLLGDRLGMRMPARPRLFDRRRLRVVGAQASAARPARRFKHDGWSFEIVDMDGRKIDKLIASRPKRAARRRRRKRRLGRRLELAETLLEAVDVAAREIVGLLDDPVARDAAAERRPTADRAGRSPSGSNAPAARSG